MYIVPLQSHKQNRSGIGVFKSDIGVFKSGIGVFKSGIGHINRTNGEIAFFLISKDSDWIKCRIE